ncbi:MAG TPA: hypothetical protein VLG50_07250 [Candidatus Saccharimonadales bacterium]|nr:hypothetical protein [Candidatus Saccharimonadales bacterium]
MSETKLQVVKFHEMATNIIQQRKKLVSVILQESDNKSKLQKLRLCLLECQYLIQDNFLSLLMLDVKEMSLENIQFVNDIMEKVTALTKSHKQILDKIGEVIRSNLTDEDKIDNITNILI